MFGQATATVERSNEVRDYGYAPPRASVQTTSAVGSQLKLDKHRSVFRAGDDAERFFVVESGAVMVYRILDDGRRQLVEVVFPGGICGLAAGDVHESSCETLTPTVLRSHKMLELARSDELRARVVRKLQRQVSAMHEHAVSLGRKTAEERICSLILRLHGLNGDRQKSVSAVALPMSRTEIADYLGLTLETVCRTISSLSRRKVLATGKSKNEIFVPNLERLRQAACSDAV
jgi:CRP/FNR family transcriptional regulator, anaerobic regulatory protein